MLDYLRNTYNIASKGFELGLSGKLNMFLVWSTILCIIVMSFLILYQYNVFKGLECENKKKEELIIELRELKRTSKSYFMDLNSRTEKILNFDYECKVPLIERGVNLNGWRVPYNFSNATQHFQIEINSPKYSELMNQLFETYHLFSMYANYNKVCFSLFGGGLISIFTGFLIPWDDDIDLWIHEKDWEIVNKLWINSVEPDLKGGECKMARGWYRKWKCRITLLYNKRIEILKSEYHEHTIKIRMNNNKEVQTFFIDIYNMNHKMLKNFSKFVDTSENCKNLFVKGRFPRPYEDVECFYPKKEIIKEMLVDW